MEGLANAVSFSAGFCFFPDIGEQRGHDGVSRAPVPAVCKELESRSGVLAPRALEAKNDKRACAKVLAANAAGVTRLANNLLRRTQGGQNCFLRAQFLEIVTSPREPAHSLDRVDEVVHRDGGCMRARGVAACESDDQVERTLELAA